MTDTGTAGTTVAVAAQARPPAAELGPGEVRRLALAAQGLLGRPFPLTAAAAGTAGRARRVRAVGAVLDRLGAVQLDTIAVLARSHELIPYARLGPVGREAVESAYWGDTDPDGDARTYEYWSHAACVLPASTWPWFAFRRRAFARRGIRWHEVPTHALDDVLARIRDEGPLTTTHLGGAKRSGQWWDWSEAKIAVEWLLDVGQVVCSRRVGWRRHYDLPARALPGQMLDPSSTPGTAWVDDDGVVGPSDLDCLTELLARAGATLGVGTTADLLDVHRLTAGSTARPLLAEALERLVDERRLVPVTVAGWRGQSWADPEALAALGTGGGARHRTTLLSPFDSLVWHRGRTERVFDFSHQLEAYVPRDKRVHGYFTMPVLHGGRLVARVDPKREGSVLHARTVTLETSRGPGADEGVVRRGAVEGTATALAEAARWVGCTQVVVDDVRPAAARPAIEAALAAGSP